MMLDYLRIGTRMRNDGGAWRRHWASSWFPNEDCVDTEDLDSWNKALEVLPYTITIALPGGGRVGLVHGYPVFSRATQDDDWDELADAITDDDHVAWSLLWNRPTKRRTSRDDPDLGPGIVSVSYVLHGHDPGPAPAWTARRVVCIDTGVHMPELGHLTIAELRPGAPVLHSFKRVDSLLTEPEPRRT